MELSLDPFVEAVAQEIFAQQMTASIAEPMRRLELLDIYRKHWAEGDLTVKLRNEFREMALPLVLKVQPVISKQTIEVACNEARAKLNREFPDDKALAAIRTVREIGRKL